MLWQKSKKAFFKLVDKLLLFDQYPCVINPLKRGISLEVLWQKLKKGISSEFLSALERVECVIFFLQVSLQELLYKRRKSPMNVQTKEKR